MDEQRNTETGAPVSEQQRADARPWRVESAAGGGGDSAAPPSGPAAAAASEPDLAEDAESTTRRFPVKPLALHALVLVLGLAAGLMLNTADQTGKEPPTRASDPPSAAESIPSPGPSNIMAEMQRRIERLETRIAEQADQSDHAMDLARRADTAAASAAESARLAQHGSERALKGIEGIEAHVSSIRELERQMGIFRTHGQLIRDLGHRTDEAIAQLDRIDESMQSYRAIHSAGLLKVDRAWQALRSYMQERRAGHRIRPARPGERIDRSRSVELYLADE